MIGGEHDSERREDHVERVIREWQALGVAPDKGNVHAFGQSARPSTVEQRQHVINPNDVAGTPCRCNRSIPAARCDVENPLSTPEIDGFAQFFGDNLKRRPHHCIIA
jgi:hypothetical protein